MISVGVANLTCLMERDFVFIVSLSVLAFR
jgi:hypothetical protein